jgi:hypothetical protein
MEDQTTIGEARDADELVALLRARKAALQISDVTIDELAGFQQGYVGKLLGVGRIKTLGAMSLSALLGVLALKLVVVVDEEQEARMKRRWLRRDKRYVVVREVKISPSLVKRAAPAARAMTARMGGKARWKGKPASERAAHIAKMNLAKLEAHRKRLASKSQ